MKYTLLDIVQEILSDMDSDEVNSIDDTAEAGQVATIVKSTYLAMMSNRNWPHQRKGITFTSFSSPDRPTHMKLSSDVKEVCFVNYNVAKNGEPKKKYQPVSFLDSEEFLRKTNKEDSTKSNVQVVVDPSGIELLIRNDRAPEYYTTFNDEDLVFDSFDNEIDTTLQESKIQSQGYVMSDWVHKDDAVPDIPDTVFTSLIEEAKSRASTKLRQIVDRKSEQEAVRQRRWLARKSRRNAGGIKFPNYGRGTRKGFSKGSSDPTFSRS